jgi:hypothetical protein
MSDLANHLDQAPTAATQIATWFNSIAAAMSGASALGQRDMTTNNTNWGYYGVTRWWINAALATKANAVIAMANGDNYISADRALAVSKDGSAFAPDKLALFKVTLSAGATTDRLDYRDPHHVNRFLYGRFVLAMADANQTLSYEQAMCESMELTGALTALCDVVVPLVPRSYTVFANTSGGFGVRVIGATGTGITVADGKRAIVEFDGTNVIRVTADV